MTERLLTPEEVASILNTSRTSIHRLISRSNDPLPSYKISGVKIDSKELALWIKRQKRQVKEVKSPNSRNSNGVKTKRLAAV